MNNAQSNARRAHLETDSDREALIAAAIPGAVAGMLSLNMVKDLRARTDSPAMRIVCQRWLGIWGKA